MNHLLFLIKPASSSCNMACKYCFYHDISKQRLQQSYGIMSDETAQIVIDRAFEVAQYYITFAFQGGEPTLAKLDFFKMFVEKVNSKNTKNLKVNYSIQTNGLNVSREMAQFFKDNNFLVGLSLDGPEIINDSQRIDLKREGTSKRVQNTSKLFDEIGVEYNILCVANAYVAKHIEKVYRYFKKQNFKFLQFIPCLDPLGEQPFKGEYSIKPGKYAEFLKKLFDLWYADFIKGDYISIRFFDNLVSLLLGQPPEQCGMSGICPGQMVIEADGSVYPCDFYCVDQWKLDNLKDMSVKDLYASDTMQKFIETSKFDTEKCNNCTALFFCRGGCRRNRDHSLYGTAGDNIYCNDLKEFFTYAAPMLQNCARIVKQN